MISTINIGGKIMSDKKSDYPDTTAVPKPKEQNMSEIIQKGRADGSFSSGRVNLRDLLVQRTMARHGFSKEQALAFILAFGGS